MHIITGHAGHTQGLLGEFIQIPQADPFLFSPWLYIMTVRGFVVLHGATRWSAILTTSARYVPAVNGNVFVDFTMLANLFSCQFCIPPPRDHHHRLADLFSSQNPPFLVGGCLGSLGNAFLPGFVDRRMDILAHMCVDVFEPLTSC